MKAPWANILLFVLLLLQIVSGYLGMVNNQERQAWVLWWHGIGAYAILLLFVWKGRIILDAIRRKTVWTGQRIIFLLTLFLLLLTLLLGLLWTFNGPQYFLNISYVSWHIYLAIPLIGLMLWHSWRMRFILRLPKALDRRQFLRAAFLSLGGAALWQGSNLTKSRLQLSGARRRFTGSYARGDENGRFPIVSWLFDFPDPVDLRQWQLQVDGAVHSPRSYRYAQLREIADVELTAVLDCTGGWYTEQTWRGVPLGKLLAASTLNSNAASVTVRAISGYKRRFSLAEANRYLLALDVAGAPLSHGHGFPLRLVALDKRGVEWVKWVSHIQVNHSSKLWQLPLPLQ